MTIQAGQEMKPGDHFIQTPDGKHRLTFPTKLEAQRAQVFMEHAVQFGREQGEDRVAATLEATIESVDGAKADLEELLGILGRANIKRKS